MRIAVLAVVIAGVLISAVAQAQVSVGLLWVETDLTSQALTELRAGLREQGYIEGQNLRFEQRVNIPTYDRLPKAAAELVQRKVDVIVSWGNTASRAASHATSTIPIVMFVAADPVASGFASSLSRPGGNMTGLTSLSQNLTHKRIELLKEMVPRAQLIAVLINPASKEEIEGLKEVDAAARLLGLRVHVAEARGAEDIDPAIAAASRAGVNALIVVPSSMLRANRVRVAHAAVLHRLPSIFPDATFVDAGGLMSYGRNPRDSFRVLAGYVAKILKGAKPAELPIEQISKFELVVNAKTAKALGLRPADSITMRADRLIE